MNIQLCNNIVICRYNCLWRDKIRVVTTAKGVQEGTRLLGFYFDQIHKTKSTRPNPQDQIHKTKSTRPNPQDQQPLPSYLMTVGVLICI